MSFDPSTSGQRPAPGIAGMAVLVVGPASYADEALHRSLRHGLAVAEFTAGIVEAERLLPRCHFDCVVVEVASATDPGITSPTKTIMDTRTQYV